MILAFSIFACLFGYSLFLNNYIKIGANNLFIVVASLISSVLFYFAIINQLAVATKTIFFLGIILFIFQIIRRHNKIQLANPANILMLMLMLFAYFRMIDSYYTGWDNFSHWGIITKEIFLLDRLTDKNFTSVIFPHYAPISALWNYFIAKINGNVYSEGIMLFANSILYIFAALILFDNNKILKSSAIILLFFAVIKLSLNSFSGLYVDGLINITAGSAILIYIKAIEKIPALISLIPILFFLTLLKSSSAIFTYFVCIIILSLHLQNHRVNNKSWAEYLVIFLLFLTPLIASNSWQYITTSEIPDYKRFGANIDVNWYVMKLFYLQFVKFLGKESSIVFYFLLSISFFIVKSPNLKQELNFLYKCMFILFLIYMHSLLFLFFTSTFSLHEIGAMNRYLSS